MRDSGSRQHPNINLMITLGGSPGPQLATEGPDDITAELEEGIPDWSRPRLDAAIKMLEANLACLESMRAGDKQQAEQHRQNMLRHEKRYYEVCAEEDGGELHQ